MLPSSTHRQVLPLPSKLPLSDITAYYLERLIQQRIDRLRLVSDKATPIGDMVSTVRQLEQLALQHQTLSSQGAKHHQSLQQTEAEIFRLLGFNLDNAKPQATILVVDDTPEVLQFFSETLARQGYEVCSAISGTIALNHATQIQPDLILLDIMMPTIDGYEVCERLKADPNTENIPVIFVSAIHEPFDKVKAFNMGGVDYLTKPIQVEELLIRIEHQLTLQRFRKQMMDQNLLFRTEVEQQLQAATVYRQFFDQAVDGLYRISPEGKFVEVNAALATLLGYDDVETLLQVEGMQRLYVSASRWGELLQYLYQYGRVQEFESQVLRPDGSHIWISESVHAVRNEDGIILGLEGIVRDVTQRKEYLERLLQDRWQQEQALQ
ncbi:MAG: hypothetical protein B0A82_02765 [Alkalinema sp. CACIAM 70d]|nr:MAG: hypothetical protein B0A82_02765 [Alkalinema sp. CACIAM 70d]